MKKIFITIPWFYPAWKAGGPVQSIANMVHELEGEYRFYIYTSNTDLDGEVLNGVEAGEWSFFNASTQVWYAEMDHRSNTLLKQLDLVQPDVLYMVGLFSWYFTQLPLFFSKVPVKLLSVRGMLHPGALSEKKWKKRWYLQLATWLKLPQRTAFHATDATERGFILNAFGQELRLHEAGNFPRRLEAQAVPEKKAGQLKLISLALKSPMKNILGVIEALKQCKAQIEYAVYGPVKDAAYWTVCLEAIASLPGNIRVIYDKTVTPPEVPGVLGESQVFILPSKSENFGHAIYEALSAGLPVITSHHTPWNGLEDAGAGMNVADETPALTAAINFFAAMDAETFDTRRSDALAYARGKVDLDVIRKQYHEMFTQVKASGNVD